MFSLLVFKTEPLLPSKMVPETKVIKKLSVLDPFYYYTLLYLNAPPVQLVFLLVEPTVP